MESLDFQNYLKQALSKTVFGPIPELYQNFDASVMEPVLTVMKKYDGISPYDIIYAEFIEEFFASIMPGLIQKFKDKKPFTTEEIGELQYINRLLLVSAYFKQIEDRNIPPFVKAEKCYFLYNFLYVGKTIYNFDMIADQDAFLVEVKKHSANFQAEMQKAREQFPELSEVWPSNMMCLINMGQALHRHGFIEDAESFKFVFAKNWQESARTCNWKLRATSLMFLFSLLHPDIEERIDFLLPFIAQRFSIGGELKPIKNLREALRGIEGQNELPISRLTGQYQTVQKIYSSLFHTNL